MNSETRLKKALEKIEARKECTKLDGKVGFGTAIPFCIDKLINRKY